MKKILKFLPAVLAAVALVVATSLSWLAIENPVDFPDSFSGSTRVSYFAGGDGSKKSPYLITTRTHMYNLAWLQYLGYFNLGGYINNGRAQSFFKVTENIDMEGLALPPIGTKEYPFIGNFDGNGKVVSDFIVSNTKSTSKSTDYNLKVYPRGARFDNNGVLTTTGTVTDTATRTQVDIIGMFGVAGDLTLDTSGNSFVSSYYTKSDLNIQKYDGDDNKTLVTLPEDTTANDFYYSGMAVSGFYIDQVKVNSESAKSLIGILAGFICSSVQNTGVYRGKISVAAETSGGVGGLIDSTNNSRSYDTVVSKYSLVGDYDENLVGWSEDPSSSGGNEDGGWGGSIDMKMINRRVGYMFTQGAIDATNKKSTSETYRTDITISEKSNEYYWYNLGTKTAMFAYLNGNTVIPLNVDEDNMYLGNNTGDPLTTNPTGYPVQVVDENDKPKNDSNGKPIYYDERSTKTYGGSALHTNWYYKNNNSEIADVNRNSGYIVGYDGTDRPRLRMQGLNGINKSLGTDGSVSSFDKSKLLFLTTNAKGTITYKIADSSVTGNSMFSYDSAPNDFKYYDDVRDEFCKSMAGQNYIHGFHFMNIITLDSSLPKKSATNVLINGETFTNYEFVAGSLNFSVKTQNRIRVIVGTYYRNSGKHALFDLFQVERYKSGENAGNIKSITRIKNIYQNADGDISYNGDTVGGDEIINFEEINKSSDAALKELSAAYYYEIPVVPGDYVIGGLKNVSASQTAYIMYLDIGANGDEGSGGSGGSKTLPYIMQSVDFVSMSDAETGDTISVPESGYPSYNDVGVKLGGDGTNAINDEIFFKREKHPADVTSDINTTVYYLRQDKNIVCTLVPSDSKIGEENANANW